MGSILWEMVDGCEKLKPGATPPFCSTGGRVRKLKTILRKPTEQQRNKDYLIPLYYFIYFYF